MLDLRFAIGIATYTNRNSRDAITKVNQRRSHKSRADCKRAIRHRNDYPKAHRIAVGFRE
jgi:hypothetical protein